jgi:Lon protease-like protein
MSEWDRIHEQRMDHGVVRWIDVRRGILDRQPRRYTHYECERRLAAADRAFSRWFARTVNTRTTWDDPDMNAHEIRQLRDRLADMRSYVEHAERHLDTLEGVDRRAERIRQLRDVAGRTPEEAAAYLAKAAELEGGS